MKTTLEIADELYRALKAKAALEGKPVTQLVVESLSLAIEGKAEPMHRVEFPIIKSKPGGKKIALGHVKRAQDELDDEKVNRFVQLMRR